MGRRAASDDFAAQLSGGGTEVQQAIGGRHDIAVVFDQQQRIAQVAQLVEGFQQTPRIAGVQADGRFIQDVEHAAQSAADLAGQADALRFASRERRGRAGQRQVSQPHIAEKLHAAGDFPDQFASDFLFARVQLPALDGHQQLVQRHAAVVIHRPVSEADGGRVITQAAAATIGAGNFVQQMFQAGAKASRKAGRLVQGRVNALVLEAEGGDRSARFAGT